MFRLSWNATGAPLPPPNDDFANAARLVDSPVRVGAYGLATYATRQSGEPALTGGAGRTLWYRWTPWESGVTQLSSSGVDGPIVFDNRNATREPGEPAIVGNAGGHSIWFDWTPATDGTATVKTIAGTTFDSTLAVYTGDTLAGLHKLVEDNDSGGNKLSLVQF